MKELKKVSLQNTWKKLPSKGKSLYRGPEAGVAGSVKEQPRGFLLWLECSEPGRENIRSRSSKGLFGLLRTLLFLLSTRENHVEFRTINFMMWLKNKEVHFGCYVRNRLLGGKRVSWKYIEYHNCGLGCHGDSVVDEKWLNSGHIWKVATDLLIFWVRVVKESYVIKA